MVDNGVDRGADDGVDGCVGVDIGFASACASVYYCAGVQL